MLCVTDPVDGDCFGTSFSSMIMVFEEIPSTLYRRVGKSCSLLQLDVVMLSEVGALAVKNGLSTITHSLVANFGLSGTFAS